jgi:hypothetical protein
VACEFADEGPLSRADFLAGRKRTSALLRNVSSTPRPLASLVHALEFAGPHGLPRTIDALARMGLSRDLAEALRAVIAAGHDEREVVEAFLEAVATWADDAATPLSRHLRRAMLHLFADAAQGRDVRALARVMVDEWAGSAVAAHAAQGADEAY